MSEQGTGAKRAEGRLPEAARFALAASALLLRPPDERTSALLQAVGAAKEHPLAALRQSFYDRFCIPQSGLYIPPFEHVFRRREKIGSRWHFPPARFDGGAVVEGIYGRFGFRHTELDADPILRAPHLPGDHLGFMLAFVGWVLEGMGRHPDTTPKLAAQIERFIAVHLDGWVEAYGELLQECEPFGYLAAVGQAVNEAVAEVREVVAEVLVR